MRQGAIKLKIILMHYVYILRSIHFPEKIYIGFTEDLSARLDAHNAGHSLYTSKHKPWTVINFIAFDTKKKAATFEKFLKSGSGAVFLKKYFL